MNSLYTQKPKASQGTTASPEAEESGWTAYFEDISHNNEEHSYCSSCDSSSLLSDAASGVAWKLSHNNHLPACSSIRGSPKISNKLKFKKTRAKEICQDDSLEDTASSPVNDPNVRFINLLTISLNKSFSFFSILRLTFNLSQY